MSKFAIISLKVPGSSWYYCGTDTFHDMNITWIWVKVAFLKMIFMMKQTFITVPTPNKNYCGFQRPKLPKDPWLGADTLGQPREPWLPKVQGLIQWGGGQRGHAPPPSWGKIPQTLGKMPSKFGQYAFICTKVLRFHSGTAPNAPFRGQIANFQKFLGGGDPWTPLR